ncbi:MAG: MlaD family protein [Bdellovibrionota bacterium]
MDQTKTNIVVGAFAVVVLAMLAYGAVRLGPTHFGKSEYKSLVVYVPSATGIYKDSSVRIAGVKVGLVDSISLDKGVARVEVRLRGDVELFPNARAVVKSEGLLGDRYIEIEPGNADPYIEKEQAGPPDDRGPRIIYADEEGGIEDVATQLGKTGKNLEAITNNLRAVLENKPGGNEDLAQTLKALAKLTTNLAEITGENRKDFRELVTHLRRISETLDNETPQVASDLRKLIGDLNELVSTSKSDLQAALGSFRTAAERFDKSLQNIEEITGKINDGQGTIGRLINDDSTVEEVNRALKGINSFVDFANRLEVRLGYRAEVQVRQPQPKTPDPTIPGRDDFDAKSVISLELWPKPDKYYFLHLVTSPSGTRPRVTRTVMQNDDPFNPGSCVSNPYFPCNNTQTLTSTDNGGVLVSLGIGKRFEYVTFFGGLIESSGGFGMSLSPDRYKHWEAEVTMYGFDRQDTTRPILKGRVSYSFLKYFYLTAGAEDILADNTKDIVPFFGGGLSFVEDDIKPLLSQVQVPASGLTGK